jgi:predicted transcriptional regulator YdeE
VFFNAFLAVNSINRSPTTPPSLGNRSSPATSRFHSDIITEFKNSTEDHKMADSSQETPMEINEETTQKSNKRKATTDVDGYTLPARPRRLRKAKIKALEINGIDTTNQFDELTDNETDLESLESEFPHPPSSKPPAKTVKSSTKPPKPIYVSSSSFAGIRNSLTSLAVTKAPDFKIVGKQIKILAQTKEDKRLIQEKLTQTKQLHYTFTEPEDRHLQFVLYGHHTNNTEELKEELVTSKIPALKISKINRSTDSPVFLVSFEKQSEISLRTLQTAHSKLNNLIVRWAKFQPRQRRPTQCHRCQRFGHSANNCGLAFRCVKCLESHEPGQCARTTREGLPSCVNCQAEGHASNSTTCPAYKKHVEDIAAKKQKDIRARQPREFPATRYNWNLINAPAVASQPPPSTSQSLPVNRNNREYRPSLGSHVNHPDPALSNPFSQLSEIQAELAAIPDIEQTIALFASLVAELKSARSQNERLTTLIKYCGNKSLQAVSQS